MKLTDWLGNEYGPGDKVIYPVGASRSIELQMAEVIDIWTVYQCPEDYKWKRLEEGEEVPTKEEFEWERSGEKPIRISKGHVPVRTELRVRLQPLGKGSRDFHTRTDSKMAYIDPDGNEISYEEMVKRLEAEHGPQYSNPGNKYSYDWHRNWDYEDFGYSSRRDSIKPKAVTLTLGIDNITKI